VPNPAAAAVDVYNAVDFAAALHTLVKDWTSYKNIITMDAEAGCVSYQQGNFCIIFSCNPPQVQFVTVEGLPPSFIGVEQAQQVRRDAREMKPDQNTSVQPLLLPSPPPPPSPRSIHRTLSRLFFDPLPHSSPQAAAANAVAETMVRLL
jgi:hypothetical protein